MTDITNHTAAPVITNRTAAPVIKEVLIVNKAPEETVLLLELQKSADMAQNTNTTSTDIPEYYEVEILDLKIKSNQPFPLDGHSCIHVNITNSLTQTSIRVRKVSKEGSVTGDWSETVCIQFIIPKIDLKPTVTNGTLQLHVTIPEKKCRLPTIRKVEITIADASNSTNNIDLPTIELNGTANNTNEFIASISSSKLSKLNKITVVLYTILGDDRQEILLFHNENEILCDDITSKASSIHIQDSKYILVLLLLSVIISFFVSC